MRAGSETVTFKHSRVGKELLLITMPTLSRFYGIKIMMYWNDHTPPHFHAEYSGAEATVGIQPIHVLEGTLPRRARSLVFEWAAEHQEELLRCWKLAREPAPLPKIEPLG